MEENSLILKPYITAAETIIDGKVYQVRRSRKDNVFIKNLAGQPPSEITVVMPTQKPEKIDFAEVTPDDSLATAIMKALNLKKLYRGEYDDEIATFRFAFDGRSRFLGSEYFFYRLKEFIARYNRRYSVYRTATMDYATYLSKYSIAQKVFNRDNVTMGYDKHYEYVSRKVGSVTRYTITITICVKCEKVIEPIEMVELPPTLLPSEEVETEDLERILDEMKKKVV